MTSPEFRAEAQQIVRRVHRQSRIQAVLFSVLLVVGVLGSDAGVATLIVSYHHDQQNTAKKAQSQATAAQVSASEAKAAAKASAANTAEIKALVIVDQFELSKVLVLAGRILHINVTVSCKAGPHGSVNCTSNIK